MTFDELLAEVYLLTNRPDLVAETKSAVKAATLKMHHTDYYSKDIYETGVEFESAEHRQSLDYITFIPNFRSLKYLRVSDSLQSDSGAFIRIITPEEVIDSYGQNKTNVAYVAGRMLEIRAELPLQYALLGAYVSPIVTEADYSSWVAIQFPYAIIYEASRAIFKMLSQDDQARAMTNSTAEELGLLRMQALSDVGF